MSDDTGFAHDAGGGGGLVLLLRWLLIGAASWLVIAQGAPRDPTVLVTVVLFVASFGGRLPRILLGSMLVGIASVYVASVHLEAGQSMSTAPQLVRIVFVCFCAVALLYGHVLGQVARERPGPDRVVARARELDAKVAERTAELQRRCDESRAASRLKSELVANMSHELRTPLNVIIGYSEMLLDRSAGGGAEQMIAGIRSSAQRLLQLVDGVLDLGKLESGKMPVVNESVPLDRFLDEVRERERLPVAPRVALVWRIASDLPVIETDRAKVTVILDNLINNAIKFTVVGSITVSARDLPAQEQAEFAVEDTGPGIAEEELPTIFTPFHQLGGATPRGGGVGLGLAIVQRYVALLGGRVEVYSTRGSGTRFVVTLPYRPPTTTAEARPEAERYVA